MHIVNIILGHNQDFAGVIAGALTGVVAVLAIVIVIPLLLFITGIKRGTVKWKGEEF